ncbi:Para-hydroxybenzoate--polyprenyltransferase, mitochondrial precursor (PHB:polyprenyltransferase) [Imshaugia aleurites]|uniref:Para-hydroxybenzoate--polyprenyltransferase, mitochondrial (PHB:polyprenyltransferase) n=1 Tax=Imshaugia aleurites TaxID=172621 RepID=A0A8H3G4R6_9LECA|nr:Para-hydroxybenzoate--polyprenyltransferase, mitochondrial precursor (PHB:polyprenyltransferase) [Imshaugia aleurites]
MSSHHPSKPPPVYQPPSTGPLSHLPPPWVPYAELLRITTPLGGTTYFYYPFLFGTLFAAILSPACIPPLHLLVLNAHLLLSAFMARNAAIAWNDLLDIHYDRQVERCRLRPLARGAISPRDGAIFAAALFALWVAIMAALPDAQNHLPYTIPYVLCNMLYPLSKRVTYYTPACIGFTIAIGVFIGNSALDVDVAAVSSAHPSRERAAIWCLYAATGTWTIVYEGTYSFQDVRDDLKAGIMSLAVGHRHHAKSLLGSAAALQVGLLGLVGWLVQASPVYFVGACVGAGLSLGWMIWSVDLGKPEDCWWWFYNGHWFVGASVGGGLLGEFLERRYRG